MKSKTTSSTLGWIPEPLFIKPLPAYGIDTQHKMSTPHTGALVPKNDMATDTKQIHSSAADKAHRNMGQTRVWCRNQQLPRQKH